MALHNHVTHRWGDEYKRKDYLLGICASIQHRKIIIKMAPCNLIFSHNIQDRVISYQISYTKQI